MRHEVVAPDGRTWRVTRRWVTRRCLETWWGRLRRRFRRATDYADGAAEADRYGCLSLLGDAIGLVVIAGLAVLLVVPLLLAVVDILVLAALAVAGAATRILLRRPWTVEATADDGTRVRWRIVGWRASRDHCDDVARTIGLGEVPPDGERSTVPDTGD
ncbi:MAG: hypothetical protein S0880_18920 [Actinomycetota bacterium]|nr:hypothetical protein [Actinomycetota bacterium]